MARTISDNQILEAALSVIAQDGYAGATTRQIASTAGINEVTLFRRFGNKKNLLMTAVQQELENFIATGIDYTGDIEADLVKVVRFHQGLMQHRSDVVVMLMSEVPKQPELSEIMRPQLSVMQQIMTLIARYQDEGVLVEEPVIQAFVGLLGPLFLGGTLKFLQPSLDAPSFDPVDVVQHYLNGRRKNEPE